MAFEFRLEYPDGLITYHRWSYLFWNMELYPAMTEFERHSLGNYMQELFTTQPLFLRDDYHMQMIKQLCRLHNDYVPRDMTPLKFVRHGFA